MPLIIFLLLVRPHVKIVDNWINSKSPPHNELSKIVTRVTSNACYQCNACYHVQYTPCNGNCSQHWSQLVPFKGQGEAVLSSETDRLCSILTTRPIAWNVLGTVTRVTLVNQHMLQVTQAATIPALESKHNLYIKWNYFATCTAKDLLMESRFN